MLNVFISCYAQQNYYTESIFSLVPPQKVLKVEDGKISTKKVKVRVKTSHFAFE